MHILLFIIGFVALILLCGSVYQAAGAAVDRKRFPPPGRLVDIGGRRLHLIESGAGSPAVVFESGLSASCLNWTHVRAEVSRFTRACAYDRAWLGWSDTADPPRTATRLVADLHTLLGAGGIAPPYILVGHSFGGLLVRKYAVEYPQEVAGLILLDPLSAGEWLRPSAAQARLLRLGIRLSRRGAWLARFGVVRFALALLTGGARSVPKRIARVASGEGESLISRLVGEVGKMPREVWPMIRAHWCLPRSFDGLALALEGLSESSAECADLVVKAEIPITIVSAGKCTEAERREREEMVARSIRGRHVVAEKSGHWVHLDQREVVVDEIRAMVERDPSASPGVGTRHA